MDTIRINIVNNGSELYVKMRKDQPLRLAMTNYCKRNGLMLDTVLFRRNDMYCDPDDTPRSLGLIHDEKIVAEY